MITSEEIREIVEENPLFKKIGTEEDIQIIINRIKSYLDPFSLQGDSSQASNDVGEVYAG